MTSKIMIASIVTLSLLSAVAPAAEPMADKTPAGAMLYVGWAGRSLTFDGSMFGQLLAEPGVKDLAGAIRSAVAAAMQGKEDAGAAFESVWTMAGMAWQHPGAIVLLDVAPPKPVEGGRRGGAGAPRPEGALMIDLQKDRDAFEAEFQKVLAIAGKEAEISRVTVGDLSYHSIKTPLGPCSMGFIGNVFFVSIGKGVPLKLSTVIGGKAKSLAKSEKFAAAMKEVSSETVQYAYYLDVSRALDTVEKVVPLPPAKEGEELGIFRKVVKALGLDGVTAVAGAGNIVDRGIHEKCRIFSAGPHRGVLMLLSGKPLAADALSGVPADADLMMTMNLDPAKLLAEIKRVAAAVDPGAGKQVEGMLAAAAEVIGMDIEKDLLAHMGDQWTLVSAPSLGGTLTGTVLSVKLKDPAKFAASLAKLETKLGEMMSGPDEGEPRPMTTTPRGYRSRSRRRGPKASIRNYTSAGVAVRYVAFSHDEPIPVAPAWAVHKDRLYIAAWPQVVVAAAGGTAEKPLAADPAFVALRNRVSPNASALSYVNTPGLLRRFYGAVLLGGTAATNMAGRFAPAIKPEMLPPLPKVEKYIWADITAVSSDDKGITIESYGSLPGCLSSWAGSNALQAPLMVSILVPSLGRARMLAKRTWSAANLNAIAKGAIIYELENDKMPPDLAAIVEGRSISVKQLYNPSSDRGPRLDARGKLIGPIDYVYLGAGMDVDAPVNMILVYEKPEANRGKGTNVAFTDTHVEWMSIPEFRRALERTQAYIKKRAAKEDF